MDPCHLRDLVQQCQHISDPYQDKLKVGAIFEAQFAKKNTKFISGKTAPQWCC